MWSSLLAEVPWVVVAVGAEPAVPEIRRPLPSLTHLGPVLEKDPPLLEVSGCQFTEQGQSTSKNDEDFCGGVLNKRSRHLHTFLWKQQTLSLN